MTIILEKHKFIPYAFIKYLLTNEYNKTFPLRLKLTCTLKTFLIFPEYLFLQFHDFVFNCQNKICKHLTIVVIFYFLKLSEK